MNPDAQDLEDKSKVKENTGTGDIDGGEGAASDEDDPLQFGQNQPKRKKVAAGVKWGLFIAACFAAILLTPMLVGAADNGGAGNPTAELVAAVAEPAQRHTIAVNDAYVTAEAAERAAAACSVAETPLGGDPCRAAPDTAADAGEAADDEYLSVAEGLHNRAAGGGENDLDC